MKLLLNKYKDQIPADAVYIGRGSMWGNPYPIGSQWGTRDDVCNLFESYFKAQYEAGNIAKEDLAALFGRPLVCFCAPARCHGETILRYVEMAKRDIEDHQLDF